MLKKVEITNFKNFNEKFTFDLSDTNNFEFNQEAVQNGIVNTGIIYGHNGCGKSNLGFAIFDLVSHLTDKTFNYEKYDNYLNANSMESKATFKFTFLFDGNIVEYEYSKRDIETLISEKFTINGQIFASVNREESTTFMTQAKGAQSLNKELGESNISIISYIDKNTILKENNINTTFKKFIYFVNNMLFLKDINERFYLGYEQGLLEVEDYIIEQGKLQEFQELLNSADIKCKLTSKEVDGRYKIFSVFQNKEILLADISSSGTFALVGFYFWYLKIKSNKKVSFFFIDEFDAFYHHDLSNTVVEMLKKLTDTQVILTTHNTSNISNDILRPDCYFLMHSDNIQSLSKRTPQELRKAHNIEKMYRAGAFE